MEHMAATQPTIADLEAAQAELEQARDALTDALSQYGRHGLAYSEAEKRVEAATRKNDELRRATQHVFVVIDLETDDEHARVLGQHRCDVEDSVEYIDTDGGIRQAPADCVTVRKVTF